MPDLIVRVIGHLRGRAQHDLSKNFSVGNNEPAAKDSSSV